VRIRGEKWEGQKAKLGIVEKVEGGEKWRGEGYWFNTYFI